jgi:hypothetical protein
MEKEDGMRRVFPSCVGCGLLLVACAGESPTRPSVTSPPPSIVPAPSPTFPSIAVGEVVRFQFTGDDRACGTSGRCRSYLLTASSDGELEVVVASVQGTSHPTIDLYIVPGADDWDTGPGPRVSQKTTVRAGFHYEIRMYSAIVPSEELELRTSLQ